MPNVRASTPEEIADSNRWMDALARVHDAQDRYALADAARDKAAMDKALRDFEAADDEFNALTDQRMAV